MKANVIPAGIMRHMGAPKRDNRETVIDYLISQEGSVILNEKQEALLTRWSTADDLMRSNRYSIREVANALRSKFGYASASAWRDIEDARFVYGNSRKPSREYLLALHVDRIEAAMVLAQKQGRLDVLPKLFDAYTKACQALPKDKHENPAPTAIVFSFTQNNYTQISDAEMDAEEAKAIAAERLASIGVAIDDIMFEEVKEDGNDQ